MLLALRELLTDLPAPPALVLLLDRELLRADLPSLSADERALRARLCDRPDEDRRPPPSLPPPPPPRSSSRRRRERDLANFFFLLEPRATANARKVATKTIPAKVRKRLALRRSILYPEEAAAAADESEETTPPSPKTAEPS